MTESERWLLRCAFLACAGLYLFHLYLIWKYAVDVPFMDEWASFEPNQLPAGLSVNGLFAQHNEHRIVTTRLLVWLLFHLNGWNLRTHQLLNFALYGLILMVSVWFVKKTALQIPIWLILSFVVFLLSPLNWSNHFWGYQSQLHFWLLFYLASSYYLFSDTQSWLYLVVGVAATILSTYSMAGGLVSSLVLLVMFGLFKATRIYSVEPRKRARDYLQLMLVAGLGGATNVMWLINYRKPVYHPPLVLPHQGQFWRYFTNIVALGFGMDRLSLPWGLFCLFIVLAPLLGVLLSRRGGWPAGQWRAFVPTLGVLAVLASVTAGRTGFGIEQSKESRYFELGMSLIPLSLVGWAVFLQESKRLKAGVIAGLWVFCFFASWNGWKDFQNYQIEALRRNAGLACLLASYRGIAGGYCPTIYPTPIPPRILEQAKLLNASFYRGFGGGIATEAGRASDRATGNQE